MFYAEGSYDNTRQRGNARAPEGARQERRDVRGYYTEIDEITS